MKLAKQKAKEEAEQAKIAEVKRKALEAAKKKALPDTVGKYMKPTTIIETPTASSKIEAATKMPMTSSKIESAIITNGSTPGTHVTGPKVSKKLKSSGFSNFDAF